MFKKCILTVLELNWNQRLGHKQTKDLSSYAHVVHTTAKQIISSRRKNENVFKMSKDEKCTCKACENTVFHCQICKFVGFSLPSSSWLLKLPNIPTHLGVRNLQITENLENNWAKRPFNNKQTPTRANETKKKHGRFFQPSSCPEVTSPEVMLPSIYWEKQRLLSH